MDILFSPLPTEVLCDALKKVGQIIFTVFGYQNPKFLVLIVLLSDQSF